MAKDIITQLNKYLINNCMTLGLSFSVFTHLNNSFNLQMQQYGWKQLILFSRNNFSQSIFHCLGHNRSHYAKTVYYKHAVLAYTVELHKNRRIKLKKLK